MRNSNDIARRRDEPRRDDRDDRGRDGGDRGRDGDRRNVNVVTMIVVSASVAMMIVVRMSAMVAGVAAEAPVVVVVVVATRRITTAMMMRRIVVGIDIGMSRTRVVELLVLRHFTISYLQTSSSWELVVPDRRLPGCLPVKEPECSWWIGPAFHRMRFPPTFFGLGASRI